jgi:RHS repeat-associated protein
LTLPELAVVHFGHCEIFVLLPWRPLLMLVGKLLRRALLIFSVSVTIHSYQLNGQTTVGIQPFGSYSGTIDQVDLARLNVHIDIPLFVHKSRGSSNGDSVHLIYDTGNNYPWLSGPDIGWAISSSSAGGGGSIAIQTINTQNCPPPQSGNPNTYYGSYSNYTIEFIDATGYAHPFGGDAEIANCSDNSMPTTQLNEYALDGSGYYLTTSGGNNSGQGLSATVIDPSGTAYTSNDSGGATVADSNGNSGIVASPPTVENAYDAYLQDTSNVAVTASGAYMTVTNGQLTARTPITISYTDTSGDSKQIVIAYKIYDVALPNSTLSPSTFALVDSITYPDGSAYHFTYQSSTTVSGATNGLLSSVQLPTGGIISYQYTLQSGCPGVAALTRTTSDGVTAYARTVSTTQSSYCIPAQSMTTVTNPDQSTETISFVAATQATNALDPLPLPTSYLETSHTWTSSTGSKSTMKCYNGSSGNCTTTSITLPVTQIATTTTLGDTGQTSKVVQIFNANQLPTEVDEYDYGASSPTRKTITTYASLGNHISNRAHSVVVQDGSGNTLSSTTYGYDEGTLLSTPSGLVTLPSPVSGTARGNQTSQHQLLTATNTTLNTSWQYDEAGQVRIKTDPISAQTTYIYDPATDSCLNNTTYAANLATSQTCDSNTGLVSSMTDFNGVTTSYTYDGMLRQVARTAKVGTLTVAATNTSYCCSMLPTTSTTEVYASPSPSEVSSTTVDGYGRTATEVNPDGTTVATIYDKMGRLLSVSNPYLTTSDLTYGFTTYAYDGLGRKTFECEPDNGNGSGPCVQGSDYKHWSYNGNVVTYQDENGNQWQRTTDALGRLTSVVEPNGTAATPSMESDYTYDALNNLLRVDQWGGAKGSAGELARVFTYDSLSRLLTASNPETGLVCYGTWSGGSLGSGSCGGGYDGDGNLIKRTDARGIVSSYSYDLLSRVTGKSYSDGTPSVSFHYDESTVQVGQSGETAAITYGLGRLTSEYVGTSQPYLAEKAFIYDPMGRSSHNPQCWNNECGAGPASGGGGSRDQWRTYDLAGNILSIADGLDEETDYSYDGAGRVIAMSEYGGFAPGPFYTEPLVSSITYGAAGPVQATLGLNQVESWSYDKRLRVTSYQRANGVNPNTIDYGYSLQHQNNGNVTSAAETAFGGDATWQYTYDHLNRLLTATNPDLHFGCSETYDAFGNRRSQAPYGRGLSCGSSSFSFTGNGTTNNNRIDGYCYDASGNLLDSGSCPLDGIHQYTYDAEGRLSTAQSGNVTYTYDAEGNSVGKTIAGNTTNTIYDDVTRQPLGTMNYLNGYAQFLTHELWLGGRHFGYFVTNSALVPTITWSATNWIGGETVRTDPSDNLIDIYTSLPFGDGQTSQNGTDTDPTHFTGKQRDTNTGLDYFGARYYDSAAGRFLTPDYDEVGDTPEPVPYAALYDPQTMNLYGYVQNNPVSSTDPDGHIPCGGTATVTIIVTPDGSSTMSQSPDDCPTINDVFRALLTPVPAPQIPHPSTQTIPEMRAMSYPLGTISPSNFKQEACAKQALLAVGKNAIFYDLASQVADKAVDAFDSFEGLNNNDVGSNPGASSLPSSPGQSVAQDLGKAASFVATNAAAQQFVRTALKSQGVRVSTRAVGKTAGAVGKYAGVAGLAYTGIDAVRAYEACMAQ